MMHILLIEDEVPILCLGLLRRKIDAGHDVKLIQTMQGFGYVLRSPQPIDAVKPEKSL
jgi:hypothetical protein